MKFIKTNLNEKSNTKVTFLKDNSVTISVSTLVNGYFECETIFIPSFSKLEILKEK